MTNPQPATFFKRWYDQDAHLSELVKTLEQLSEESQYLMSLLLGAVCEEVIAQKGKTTFLHEMDWDKISGLLKTKRGRRWYDDEPAIHRSFNLLYSLKPEGKGWVATQLLAPAKLIRQYEKHCQARQQRIDLDQVCHIVEVVFIEGEPAAEARFFQEYNV